MIIHLQRKIKGYELFHQLERFWKEVHSPRKLRNDKYILYLLQEYSKIKVSSRRHYQDRRTTKTLSNREKLKFRECFACFKRFPPKERSKFLEVHHIIQIQYGGNDFGRNTLALCKGCHKQVHAWKESLGGTVTRIHE